MFRTDEGNARLAQVVNANLPVIQKALQERDQKCVSLKRGICTGQFKDVNWLDTTAPGGVRPGTSYYGMCTVGGDNCDINTDSGWTLFVEGRDGNLEVVKVYKDYEEI